MLCPDCKPQDYTSLLYVFTQLFNTVSHSHTQQSWLQCTDPTPYTSLLYAFKQLFDMGPWFHTQLQP